MARESTGNVKPRHLLGRGDSNNYFGQTRQVSVDTTLLFTGDQLGVNPDVLGVYNLDGGDADSEYGGTTGFDGGGA